MNNRISAELSQQDYDEVMAAIQTIKAKLPFLVALPVAERRRLTKMGDKTRAFVDKAVEGATQHPEILPGTFNLSEMQRDRALFDQLYAIEMAMTQVRDMVSDSRLQVGAEAFTAGRVVYKAVKDHRESHQLEALEAELAARFENQANKGTSAAP